MYGRGLIKAYLLDAIMQKEDRGSPGRILKKLRQFTDRLTRDYQNIFQENEMYFSGMKNCGVIWHRAAQLCARYLKRSKIPAFW